MPEQKVINVVVISHDYDNCYAIKTPEGLKEELQGAHKAFWDEQQRNGVDVQEVFNQVRQIHDDLLTSITQGAAKVRVYDGSARQSYSTDKLNIKNNNNGSVFPALENLCQERNTLEQPWIFEPLLLADPRINGEEPFLRKRGEAYKRIKSGTEDNQLKIIDPLITFQATGCRARTSKRPLLLHQMWDAYRQNPDATNLEFHFIDDREDLIQDILTNLRSEDIPPGMTLMVSKFNHFTLSKREDNSVGYRGTIKGCAAPWACFEPDLKQRIGGGDDNVYYYDILLFRAVSANKIDMARQLLLAGTSPNEWHHPETKNYCLHKAVQQKNHAMVDLLLEFGADLTQKNKRNKTPIQLAANSNQWACVALILKRKTRDDNDEAHYGSVLLDAIYANQIDIAHQLITAKANLDIRDVFGNTALDAAIAKKQLATSSLLLRHGALIHHPEQLFDFLLSCDTQDPDVLDSLECLCKQPLSTIELKMHAQSYLNELNQLKIDAINKLIKSQENLDIQDKNGSTALMWAAYKGYYDIADELIKAGAKPELPNLNGNTALDEAVANKHLAISCLLLSHNAPIHHPEQLFDFLQSCDKRDSHVLDSLEYLCKQSLSNIGLKKQVHRYLDQLKTDRTHELIRSKGNLDAPDMNGATPLIWASQEGHINIVHQLIKAKANPHIQDNTGKTALMWANEKGFDNMARMLRKAEKISVNKQKSQCNTPLVKARFFQLDPLVYSLIEEMTPTPGTDKVCPIM